MSDMDPKHDPFAYEQKILSGFHELHDRVVAKSNEIRDRFKGANPSELPFGLNKVNELGEQVANFIEQADDGQWPREVLKILGKTMNHLVSVADQMKKQVRSFDVVDLSFRGITAPEPDIIH